MPYPQFPWPRSAANGQSPIVVAHRGASSAHTESSAQSFAAAIAAGADAIETDIRITRDGVLVCHHDDTLLRTSGDERAVSAVDWADMLAVSRGQAMTLEDAVSAARDCGLLLDLKLTKPADIAVFIDRVRGLSGAADLAVGVRSLAIATQVRSALPRAPLVGLLGDPNDLAAFAALGNAWWRLWQGDVTNQRISASHEAGLPLLVMAGSTKSAAAVGEISPEDLAGLVAMPVDGIMLNDPALAVQTIAVAGDRASSAR